MPLSDDQRAMLRLLAQREQGYDDLAALMGLSVDEVRAKVTDALAQLEAEGKEPPPAPAEPEPAVESPEPKPPMEPEKSEPPRAPEPAEPESPPPAKPEPTVPSPPATPSGKTASQRPKPSLPSGAGARAAILAGLAAVILVIVILAVGGGEDSGDTTTSASGDDTSSVEEAIDTTANPKLTQAVLDPIDGSDAKGVATFGRVKNSLALQIEAEGLEPTGNGQSYTVWLYESAQKMVPLASTVVPESGRIGAQVQVPTEVLAFLAKETFDQIDVSLTDDATLKASLAKATREKKAPLYTGTDVLRGTIAGPIIGAADK